MKKPPKKNLLYLEIQLQSVKIYERFWKMKTLKSMGILFFETPHIIFFPCDTNPPDMMRRKLKIKKLCQLLHHVTPIHVFTLPWQAKKSTHVTVIHFELDLIS
jgi:hypothetical protein